MSPGPSNTTPSPPGSTPPPTAGPASLTSCVGKVSPNHSGGTDEPNLLTYRFECFGSISAYTIILQQQGDRGGSIDDYDPAPSVFETDGLTPSSTESVTCGGSTPSDGINCNTATQGAQVTNEFVVQGSVDPIQPYCKHLPTDANGKTAKPGTLAVPQAVVQLVVTDFTGAEDGPFNLGPAKARNLGVLCSAGKYVLFLDSDAMISRLSLARLVERMEGDPTIGIAGCRVLDPVSYLRFASVYKGFEGIADFEREFVELQKTTAPKRRGGS